MILRRIWRAMRPWLVPLILVWVALVPLNIVPGYRFSSFICIAAAGVWSAYILLARWQRKQEKPAKLLRRILTVCLVVGLLAASVTLGFIVSGSGGEEEEEPQYVIVLGAGVHGTTPSLILSQRIRAAYNYLFAHPEAICIVSGGQGEGENISEAACMFRELTDLGVAPDRIWQEDKSTSTWENLNFTLALIEEKTGTRPDVLGVVSNEFHLFRAGLQAEDSGVRAVGIPAKTGWVSLRVNYFLREIAAVWKYLIFGGN